MRRIVRLHAVQFLTDPYEMREILEEATKNCVHVRNVGVTLQLHQLEVMFAKQEHADEFQTWLENFK